ncbi:hypothetical protein CK203_038016 [Vitis vinifera]|uniref:Uncharacterized protein n=1 Tax=Vitis vinifera TaxID=29760 RepID=A0A438HNW9_VITVI|nr:hypothetical protein CK203_038016 [Vitis vinifera]
MEGVALETREWYDVGLWKAIKRGWGAFKTTLKDAWVFYAWEQAEDGHHWNQC